jgi:hypothetical protein
VEKDQVTIVLRASQLKGPLGHHVMSVFLTSDGGVQHLVILDHDLGVEREAYRSVVPAGAWQHFDAEQACVHASDILWCYLLRYKGIQPVLPIPAE